MGVEKMEERLKQKARDLIRIYGQVNKDYRWKNSSSMNNLIALSHILKDKSYSRESIDRVNQYIKHNTSPFSCYRQKSILFSALLVVNFPDPENKFNMLLDYEDKLKEIGFKSYTYRPVTAYTLLLTGAKNPESRLTQAYAIFTEMRRNHPWLTSGDDYPLSILLAEGNKSVAVVMAEIEDIYRNLNESGFSKSNGLQFLSHVLSLSDENNRTKAERCKSLYDYFKSNKLRVYSANYGSLGLLSLLGDKSMRAAEQIKNVMTELSSDRSLKWLGRETLFLTATSLVCHVLLQDIKYRQELLHTNAFITIEALMAAQSAAMLGATCAVTASAASGSH